MRLLRIVLCVALAATLAACGESPPTSPTDTGDFGGGTISTAGGNSSNGAVVHHGEEGCAVVDGNGDLFPPPPDEFTLPCGTEVATFSKNLNAKITVHASGVPNDTGKIVHWGPYNPGQAWMDLYPELSGPPYPCYLFGTEYVRNRRRVPHLAFWDHQSRLRSAARLIPEPLLHRSLGR